MKKCVNKNCSFSIDDRTSDPKKGSRVQEFLNYINGLSSKWSLKTALDGIDNMIEKGAGILTGEHSSIYSDGPAQSTFCQLSVLETLNRLYELGYLYHLMEEELMYGDKAYLEQDSKEWVTRVERNTELFYDLCPCYMIGTSDSPSYLASLK